MKHKSFYLLLGLLIGVSALQSCVDNDYDLGDIDLTIGNDIDLTLPSSSTSEITLRSFMDLEEDGIVQFVTDENGTEIFAVVQDGKADINDVAIEDITFNPDLTDFNTTVDLQEWLNEAAPKRKANIKVPTPDGGSVEIPIADVPYHYTITPGTAVYSISEDDPQATQKVSEDIIRIDKVTFENNNVLGIDLIIEGFPEWLPIVTLQDLTLQCPGDLEVSKCTFTINNQDKDIRLADDGFYHLTDGQSSKCSFADPLKLRLTLESVSTGNDLMFNPLTHEATVAAKFEINGTFRINTADIDSDAFYTYLCNLQSEGRGSDVEDVLATGSILRVLPAELTFIGNANLENGITIKEFYGQLRHDVGSIEPITLNDLPDFLSDDDVNLDLDNPIILLKADQGLPIPVSTTMTLTAFNNGVEATKIIVNGINITGNGTPNYLYVAERELKTEEEKRILPEEYRNATYVPANNIAQLIKKIPDEIKIDIEPITLETTDTPVNLRNRYPINVEYKLYAPLILGPEFQLVYRGEDTEWSDDFDDFENINLGEIVLTAQAESNLPANVSLKLIPIDAEGNEISQLEVNDIVIEPKKATDITFTLKARQGNTLNDIVTGRNGVNQLDGVKYEARIVSNDPSSTPQAMPKDAHIKLSNIKVTLRGGVTYDAN